ncbi:Nitrogen permease regulator 3 [Sporothrix epigloea]|uniref:Nitrogen permease regulator 3 n=1 Tax=Sporothrix epigloea TaxID=1892477 RepID=A0ABP0DI90_9PEZI
MATPMALPDKSNFLGVALVINRDRDGPRFVFHYPSRIEPPQDEHHRKEFNNEHVDEDDIFVEAVAAENTLAALGRPLDWSLDFLPNAAELSRWNNDDHLVTDSGTQFVPWEYVAGLPTKALESILTPPRSFHKKRFQISLDSVTYISYPIHVPASGFWARAGTARTNKGKGKARADAVKPQDCPDAAAAFPPVGDEQRETDRRGEKTTDGEKDRERDKDKEKEKDDKVSSMNMFSLVFIMSPKRHEATELLDLMYHHIVREVNKVYKYCQESGDFVWQESKKIIQLKDRARDGKAKMSVLWKEILAASSLAASMRDIYEALSRNRIAVLELDLAEGSVGHSVQVPMPFYVTDVQPHASMATKGLWLTTANNILQHETHGGISAFERCFALLLTDDDEKKIIEELQARGDNAAAAMIDFVETSQPTLSFYQVSQLPNTMLTVQQVCAYAQHFIYWRRAIAVPPIHARDVYILSPNCDLSDIARASVIFEETFPFAPPLPDLLAGLSSAPRPYKSFCPTKNLRPAYLRILAWLIRAGWVCQLCTFAYVVVWPEIQYEVEYNLESEELARIKLNQQRQKQRENEKNNDDSSHKSQTSGGFGSNDVEERDRALREEGEAQDQHAVREEYDFDGGSNNGDVGEIGGLSEWSGTVSSMPSSIRHDRDRDRTKLGGRSAAERAAERARRQRMTEKVAHNLAERATAHARKPVPKSTSHPSINNEPHLAGFLPHVILDASKPTGKESLYLSAIERNLRACRRTPPAPSKKEAVPAATTVRSLQNVATNNKRTRNGHAAPTVDETTAWNERVGDIWPVFWKHFNGRSALERIALFEDMKRKDVWNLLSSMSEHLLCVRHW